jgi:hypothetical protein
MVTMDEAVNFDYLRWVSELNLTPAALAGTKSFVASTVAILHI